MKNWIKQWKFSINNIQKIKMIIPSLIDLVSELNYDWFKEKNKHFLKEENYNKTYKRIGLTWPVTDRYEDEHGTFVEEERLEVLVVDLVRYCWVSIFPGSKAQGLIDSNPKYLYEKLPIDGKKIADRIIKTIQVRTEKFTDVKFIDLVIKKQIDLIKRKYPT